MSKEDVRAFWDKRAEETAAEQEVTHRDIWQRSLEIQLVKRYLRREDRVLDIGCGNGFATRQYATHVAAIVGADYSSSMIARAEVESRDSSAAFSRVDEAGLGQAESLAGGPGSSPGVHSFKVLDVTNLGPAAGTFDAVISTRCLINLASWDAQKAALMNIASVIRPGGRFIFVEGSKEGRDALNAARAVVGLPAMPMVWHNIDFSYDALVDCTKGYFRVAERLHFGTYDFLSRIVHPLLALPEQPKYDAKINEVASRLAALFPQFETLSRVLFVVFEKLA